MWSTYLKSSRLGTDHCGTCVALTPVFMSLLGVFARVCVCVLSICVLFSMGTSGCPSENVPTYESALLESQVGTSGGGRACVLPSLSPQGQSVYLLCASPSAFSHKGPGLQSSGAGVLLRA